MNRRWKWIVGSVVALIVVVVAASFIYAKIIHKPDPEFDQKTVDERLNAATTTLTGSSTITSDPSSVPVQSTAATTQSTTSAAAAGATGVDGTWTIKEGSEVGYRVKESINGFDTTANGRTQSITGTIVAAGASITEGQFTVDMTTFTSDERSRDRQFNGRIMDVAKFPTSTFVLTTPIDFGAVPDEGGTVTSSATGDLTLHGTTKFVTFDVQGTFKNGLIGVLGQIPVVFADYGIPAPSLGTVSTENNGLLEFVLVLERK
jgi:polyisoprenoid-binding protein YceI